MKSCKNTISLFAAVALIFGSCQKESFTEKTEVEVNQEESTVENQRWIPWVVSGVVRIVIKLSEGQYYATYYPNGNMQSQGCSGVGTCAMGGSIDTGNDWEEISSSDYTHELDLSSNSGIIAVTNEDKLILGVEDARCENDFFESLFYSDKIEITRELKIDNAYLLNRFGLASPILIEVGEYEVYSRDGLTFIQVDLP
jgi:hypothetical protein